MYDVKFECLDCPRLGPPMPPTFAYPIPFFDLFFDVVFGRKVRGPKIILISSKRPLGADMCDFGPQLGAQNGPKMEVFRYPRANLC